MRWACYGKEEVIRVLFDRGPREVADVEQMFDL